MECLLLLHVKGPCFPDTKFKKSFQQDAVPFLKGQSVSGILLSSSNMLPRGLTMTRLPDATCRRALPPAGRTWPGRDAKKLIA